MSSSPARGARIPLFLMRMLTPALGAPRAQWMVARGYALIYLVRYYLMAQYARASIGILWVVLAPVLLMSVYLPIYLFVFKAPGSDRPIEYALFCLVGLMAWAAVTDAIGQGASMLVSQASIVRHAPTPPIMLPVIKVLGSFAGFACAIVIALAVLGPLGRLSLVRLCLLPAGFTLLLLSTSGVVLLLSALAAYVRDLLQILPTLLAIEFLAAPIVYGPNPAVPAPLALAIRWNPLTPFLALLRAALLPNQPFAWSDLGLAAAWAVIGLAVGVATFRKLEAGLGDVI